MRPTPDGRVTYLVRVPPEALPPVSKRDLELAWGGAHQAALRNHWGVARLFRFLRPDGSHVDFALADPDACCWAEAVDQSRGLHTAYGLSLCLRLLALIDLLARANWTEKLYRLASDGAELDPALLGAAAHVPLDSQGRFDETKLRAQLVPETATAPTLVSCISGVGL
ncbi:MAG: hypothetical protein JOY71_10660 [Acetobacteraceae bacterium]|nr:hypothetical protein [Acetobacteraceae bacterium]MBV8522564.1 hypothetical protein [Acetobacteraceae bacterium]